MEGADPQDELTPESLEDQLPDIHPAQYPPDAVSDEQRQRFRLAEGIARQIFGDDGEAAVWHAARSIYRSDLPT